MNHRDLATLLAPHITDSVTWCRMTQVCRRFRDTLNSLLIKKTDKKVDSFNSYIKWFGLPPNGSVKHGVCQTFFDNGELSYQDTYKNGKKHGTSKSFFKDGQPHYIFNYRDGELHGLQKEWYSHGTLRSVCTFRDGQEVSPRLIEK